MATITAHKTELGAAICTDSLISELGEFVPIITEDREKSIDEHYNFTVWGYEEIRYNFVEAFSYNTDIQNNDLDRDFSFKVYCKEGYSDAFWSRECYVEVEGFVYFVDGCLGDTSFLTWRAGWYVQPFNGSEYDDSLAQRLSAGYSSNPTRELEELLTTDPAYSEKFGCWVGRIEGHNGPIKMYPSEY